MKLRSCANSHLHFIWSSTLLSFDANFALAGEGHTLFFFVARLYYVNVLHHSNGEEFSQ